MSWKLKGTNVLHIYAQDAWHQEAYIVGNKEGLLELRNAIDEALKSKEAVANVFPTDGEGYDAYVLLVDENEEDKFHSLKLPYTGKNMRFEVKFDDEEVNIHHPHVLVKNT
ncbi:hypothetical protein AB3Z07_02765 [Metabacillus halosaccharovorans]|uniref:hypothetical protein n=1 Tax=Metabacillus halosaccharovorans TaxID=930124 RepID=UPI00203F2233|nr:hypothetical protein [Metabacillus halosaccharovorans]MCM3442684.1 hypothetical protein [Metabacillus halosaccharovorans]